MSEPHSSQSRSPSIGPSDSVSNVSSRISKVAELRANLTAKRAYLEEIEKIENDRRKKEQQLDLAVIKLEDETQNYTIMTKEQKWKKLELKHRADEDETNYKMELQKAHLLKEEMELAILEENISTKNLGISEKITQSCSPQKYLPKPNYSFPEDVLPNNSVLHQHPEVDDPSALMKTPTMEHAVKTRGGNVYSNSNFLNLSNAHSNDRAYLPTSNTFVANPRPRQSDGNSYPQNYQPMHDTLSGIGHPTYNDINLNGLTHVLTQQNEISLRLANNFELASLPKREVPVFDGTDTTAYPSFMQAFQRTIHDRCSLNQDRLYYLEQYTKGYPHEIVHSCSHSDPSEAYHTALKLLHDEYGHEYRLTSAYLKKLQNWPDIRADDRLGMNRFLLALMDCNNFMRDHSSLSLLNSPAEIRKLVMKLQRHLRERWRDKYLALTSPVKFNDFVNFVQTLTRGRNDPYFGDLSDERPNPLNRMGGGHVAKRLSMSTKVNNIGHVSGESVCLMCKKPYHQLNQCYIFKKLTVQERWNYVKENRLCFACLGNHHRRQCKSPEKCNSCGLQHITLLHDQRLERTHSFVNTTKGDTHPEKEPLPPRDTSNNPDTSLATHVKICSTKMNLYLPKNTRQLLHPVLPVITRVNGRRESVLTYIALDNYSSDVLMDQKLAIQLGAKCQDSKIGLTTVNGEEEVLVKVLNNLEITDLDGNERVRIPVAYAMKEWTFTKEDIPTPAVIEDFPYLREVPFKFIDANVGIIVGMNHPEIFRPLQIIHRREDEPYASEHKLGWTLNGPTSQTRKNISCMKTRINFKEDLEIKIRNLFTQDFSESCNESTEPSIEDRKWEAIVKTSLKQRSNKNYEIRLPLRSDDNIIPLNKAQVYASFKSQQKRLEKDPKLMKDYEEFMNMMLQNKFMERIPTNELNDNSSKTWYISHHGVYHKQKKKIRVVFNCSLKHHGISLNDRLLPGPDLTNSLLGVMLRFRQGKFAFMADIEKMFYAVKVPPEHTNLLRLFWYSKDSREVSEYRLLVHVFGATSSPAIANFALKQTVLDNPMYSEAARKTVNHNFYVDDCLKSVDEEEAAVNLLREVTNLVAEGGFKLTGTVSNSRNILSSVPCHELGKDLQNLDLFHEDLPSERALGVMWNTESDTLSFKVNLIDQPSTRRGVLSTIHSIYDPLGLAGPATIMAKKIFQETCELKLKWDEMLPQGLKDRWLQWLQEVPLLQGYEIARCLKPPGKIIRTEIHFFCDGSECAYGSIAYIRFITDEGHIHCSPLLAKVRLTPLTNSTLKTIPRIELSSAKLSVMLQQTLQRELEIEVDCEYFWTDSTTVLKYITNETRRFQRFVANRISFIRNHSNPLQWKYVPSKQNPADVVSRGIVISKFIHCDEWRKGPTFLWKENSHWPTLDNLEEMSDQGLEYKKEIQVRITTVNLQEDNPSEHYLESSSLWYGLKRKLSWLTRFQHGYRNGKIWNDSKITLEELDLAAIMIFKFVQQKVFHEEIRLLNVGQTLKRGSSLRKLCPFMGKEGLLRVGGRLQRAIAPYDVKHPIILPGKHHVTKLIIESIHRTVGHLGRETVLANLRQKYWVVTANRIVRGILNDCISCRKRHAKPSSQVMADLPMDRLMSDNPPFSSTGVDYFGPFLVSRGRKTEKRYGVIFTCLACRAIHLEVSHTLDTDSFINAVRRFISRRGNVKLFRSDNGTNLTGGCSELRKAIHDWNQNHIEEWMKQKDIVWKFQPPSASHFGGVWERVIRSVRNVFDAILSEQPHKLNDESLNTLFCEVESILNSRPLTEASSDPNDLEALTPNHILLKNSEITFPPGLFNPKDTYAKRKWRQVQYLADLFWTRWRKEYLPLLQTRQKWLVEKEPHQQGDLVLVVDNLLPRNQWSLGQICEVYKDSGGHIRSAKITMAKGGNNSNHISSVELERPITKLILLRRELM